MTKTKRKILLSIALFLALVCFAIGLNVGLAPNTAKAEGTLSISSIRQINLQAGTNTGGNATKLVMPDAANNNSASAYGWGSLYLVQFDTTENLFPLANDGDLLATASDGTVTAVNTNYDLTSVFNSIKVGRKEASFASLAGGSAIFKYSSNTIALKSNRVIGWTCFKFAADMSIAGYTLDSAQTWWENQDWTFTKSDVEQEFMINNIWVVSTSGNYATINIAHNRAFAVDKSLRFAHIYINGQQIVDENGKLLVDFVQPYNTTEANWGNEYDAGASGGAFKLYINASLISNKELTIQFKQGFKLSASQTDSLPADQTFKLGKDYYNFTNQGATGDFSSMWNLSDLPVFINAEKEMRATEVNYVGGCNNSTAATGTYSEYTVKFNKNLFANLETGADITTYVKDNTNLMRKVLINSMPLYLINNGTTASSLLGTRAGCKVTIFKVADDTVKINVKNIVYYADVTVLAGLRIGEYATAYDDRFYQDNSVSDGQSTFSKLDQAPAFKVFDVYTIAYGAAASTQSSLIKIVFNRNPWIKQDANFDEFTNDFSSGVTTNADIADAIFANGEQVYHGTGTSTVTSAASEIVYGFTQLNVTIVWSKLDGNPTVLTFANGWTVGYETLTIEQEFMADSNNYNEFWGGNKLPKFTELTAQTINYKQGDNVIKTESNTKAVLPVPSDITGYVAGKLFFGWTDGEKLYKAGETIWGLTNAVDFEIVELDAATIGMGLKTYGEDGGARFETKINLAEYTAIAKFLGSYGTLIARADDLAGSELTVESAQADSKVKMIESTQCDVRGDYVHFFGGVNAMPESNYVKTIVGRAYIEVNYASGVEYVYSEAIERVMADVANEILDGQLYADEELDWLNKYAGINA